jgi:hypothetical protein
LLFELRYEIQLTLPIPMNLLRCKPELRSQKLTSNSVFTSEREMREASNSGDFGNHGNFGNSSVSVINLALWLYVM